MDVVIVSCGKNDLKLMTQQTIDSLIMSENFNFNVIVVESESVEYKNCLTIKCNETFNYNRFVNIGLSHCYSDIVSFCNNDLIFHKNWMTFHMKVFNDNSEIHSLSPKCDLWKDGSVYKKHEDFNKGIHLGFRTGFELVGWCITVRKFVLDDLNGLDTSTNFWYSDNNYAMQLMTNGYQHALNANSTVTHLFGKSSILLTSKEFENMTIGQEVKFLRRWNII